MRVHPCPSCGVEFPSTFVFPLSSVCTCDLAVQLAALRSENERLRQFLQTITKVEPSSGIWDEWGEAECYQKAVDLANKALSDEEAGGKETK